MTTDYSVTSCIEINVNSEKTLNLICSYKILQSKKIHHIQFYFQNEKQIIQD